MAVVTQTNITAASKERRLWRTTIETPKGQPYFLDLHREERAYDANGNQIGDSINLPALHMSFDAIKTDNITVSGITLTIAQIAEFIVAYADQKEPT